jgi:hypothetical protein
MSLAQLSRLLPLPDDELKQVLDYAATLSKPEAAEHFGNLLGDSPQAIEFISSFNSRRQTRVPVSNATPEASSANNSDVPSDGVPKHRRGQNKKKKAAIHTPAARQIDTAAPLPGTTYNKKDQLDDYIVKRPSPAPSSSTARPPPPIKSATPPPPQQRTAAGYLISEGQQKAKPKSTPVTRSSTPKPSNASTKISIAGGTPMAGASTALTDLDAAIRALEISTNPTLQQDANERRCNCVATRHGLQSAAPNCLSCGKVICLKEGLGPCTYCGTPLLTPADVQAMVKELRSERGREKMAADREAHKRAEVSKKPAAFSTNLAKPGAIVDAEAKALQHRDKLLGFQAQNAQRTTVRDEAADFDVTGAMAGSGGSMWSTPEERAKELKRQQKLLREMEWNARPEYEKRRQIVSIDLVNGKVVKKMAAVERPASPVEDDTGRYDAEDDYVVAAPTHGAGGAFSKNPLLGHIIRPVYEPPKSDGKVLEGRKDRKAAWRRVQDDRNDNEGVILDGGIRGHKASSDEPACG